MAAYRGAYHEDSDADDEYERSVIMSPALPPEFESSPTDSDPLSAEHTPTTYTHSGSHPSPTSPITQWTAEQCADFISNLGLAEYAEAFIGKFSCLSEGGIRGWKMRLTCVQCRRRHNWRGTDSTPTCGSEGYGRH